MSDDVAEISNRRCERRRSLADMTETTVIVPFEITG